MDDTNNINESEALLPPHHSSSKHHRLATTKRRTRTFLASKTGHYLILALVSLDIGSIFADFILQLFVCEHRIPFSSGETAQETLGIISLVFSSLFMLELSVSIWAFGRAFFNSRFHVFDAVVVVLGFVVDVVLKGVLEEIGSLVVVLRLWRVFKIIEELSAGAEEQMEGLSERCEGLERENEELRKEVEGLKARQDGMV